MRYSNLFLALAAVLVLSFIGSRQTGPAITVKTSEKVESKSRVEKKQTVTVKPDGSKVTEIITIKDTAKVSEKKAELRKVESKPQYRLGVDFMPRLYEAPHYTDIGIRGGARIGESPFWLEVGADFKHRQVTIGISVEF